MTTEPMSDEQLREAVRQRYAAAAQGSRNLGPAAATCCSGGPDAPPQAGQTMSTTDPITSGLYDATEVPSADALAASLGCGNPTALADLRPGMDVLDLGSGGGLDVLLSARRVAPSGTAYGVDMTDEMLQVAEQNRAKAGIENARFVKGTIEDLPLPDGSVDVVISNCVINLSTDKDAVLRECHRVLRPGGRFAVSDIVMLREVPEQVKTLVALWTGCLAGALRDTAYLDKLTRAGFTDAEVTVTRRYTRADLEDLAESLDPGQLPAGMTLAETVDALEGAFASAFVRAVKPDAARLGAATGER